ncbi:MAG TPA: hypothetical protein P5081_13700 [Phycisphaerae bacterium]|nr:hypothetical protein [Phycisphaerae bacterium]HRW53925.1 hypothetical protein [Phycisphaerae bacterium]
MGDISSGITPISGYGVTASQSASLSTSQPLRGDGSIQEATSGTASSRIVENARVSQSQSSISIASQQTQPQAASDFGLLLFLAAFMSDDDDKNKSNPFMALVGLALMSALQQQAQSTQFLQFDSSSLEISQSVSATESLTSQSATYQQTTGVDTSALGGQIDVAG